MLSNAAVFGCLTCTVPILVASLKSRVPRHGILHLIRNIGIRRHPVWFSAAYLDARQAAATPHISSKGPSLICRRGSVWHAASASRRHSSRVLAEALRDQELSPGPKGVLICDFLAKARPVLAVAFAVPDGCPPMQQSTCRYACRCRMSNPLRASSWGKFEFRRRHLNKSQPRSWGFNFGGPSRIC